MANSEASLTRGRGIALLLEQVCRFAYDDRGQNALHSVQWAALRFFHRANEQARTVNGLAKYLGVTSGPASRTAGSLVGRGLLKSEKSPFDARSNIFSLTDKGMALIPSDPIGRVANILADLDEDHLSQLATALDKVHSALSK